MKGKGMESQRVCIVGRLNHRFSSFLWFKGPNHNSTHCIISPSDSGRGIPWNAVSCLQSVIRLSGTIVDPMLDPWGIHGKCCLIFRALSELQGSDNNQNPWKMLFHLCSLSGLRWSHEKCSASLDCGSSRNVRLCSLECWNSASTSL